MLWYTELLIYDNLTKVGPLGLTQKVKRINNNNNNVDFSGIHNKYILIQEYQQL